jgi:hypothetical protein
LASRSDPTSPGSVGNSTSSLVSSNTEQIEKEEAGSSGRGMVIVLVWRGTSDDDATFWHELLTGELHTTAGSVASSLRPSFHDLLSEHDDTSLPAVSC